MQMRQPCVNRNGSRRSATKKSVSPFRYEKKHLAAPLQKSVSPFRYKGVYHYEDESSLRNNRMRRRADCNRAGCFWGTRAQRGAGGCRHSGCLANGGRLPHVARAGSGSLRHHGRRLPAQTSGRRALRDRDPIFQRLPLLARAGWAEMAGADHTAGRTLLYGRLALFGDLIPEDREPWLNPWAVPTKWNHREIRFEV